MGQSVVIQATAARANQRAPRPGDAEIVLHVCPLCGLQAEWARFSAHAPDCIVAHADQSAVREARGARS